MVPAELHLEPPASPLREKMFKTLIIVALGTLACEAPEPYPYNLRDIVQQEANAKCTPARAAVTVCVAEGLPAATLDALAEATARWSRALGGYPIGIEPEARGDCDVRVQEADANAPELAGIDSAATGSIGLPSEIRLVRGRYESAARYVLTHELGHSFGAEHQEAGVMFWHWDESMPDPACPDELAVNAVLAAEQLEVSSVNPCDVGGAS